MQSGDSEQDSGSAEQPSSLPLPVPGVPWWSGIGQQQPVSSAAVKTVYLDGISTAFRPTGFVYPHLMQPAPMQIVGQTPSDSQDPSVMASTMQPVSQSGYEEANMNGNQQQPVNSTVLSAPSGEYYLPQTQLELGHSMVRVPYPFADPYYGGIIAAYVAQGVVHPHMLGVQQARMPLPSEMLEEEPVYVNAKQYHGILRRRQSRAKAESENKLVKVRKPYLHESRHQHAMKRERGCGGRFLNTKSKEKSSTDNSNKSAGEQSSEESCAPDSCNANCKQAMTGPQNLGFQSVTRMPGEVTGGSEQSNANISGFTPSHGSHRPTMLSGAIQGSTYNHQNQLLHSSAFRPLAGRSDEDA